MNNMEAKQILREQRVDICMDPREPVEILKAMQESGSLILLNEAVSIDEIKTDEPIR